jgi:hypothetical protein
MPGAPDGIWLDGGEARCLVPLGGRDQQSQRAAVLDERCEAPGDGRLRTDRAAQQRSPGEVNGDQVGEPIELGGKALGGRDNEDGVRPTAALWRLAGATRGFDHAGSAGVDADHQLIGVRCRAGEDEPAVAGSDVDGYRGVRGRGIGQSADVDLGEAPASQDVHRAMIIHA